MMDGHRFAEDMLSSSRTLLAEDSSVMARMQRKFWKTKQVLIKATGKKEDEYVVASDADLDAKLEFFRSAQSTCTELLKVIEKYQHRITRLSQEENDFGLFLHFQAGHNHSKAGNMMDATSRALCSSAKQRMALCTPLHRMHQEVETFRRRAIADTLLTVGRMEKTRTEYRGALLWMKDVSQELDPDTYKQLENFRKVQSQVRGTKSQFERLKNDVCQKVDMLGASRCNMLSHSLCTYQITLLQFWEKTARSMSEIHKAFQGHVQYQFTTLKDLQDPLEELMDSKEKALESDRERGEKAPRPQADDVPMCTHNLVSLDDDKPPERASNADSACSSDGLNQSGDADASSHTAGTRPQLEDEEGEGGYLFFLKDLLSPGPATSDEFSGEWQDAFGPFDPPSVPPSTTGAANSGPMAHPPSASPKGFLPSQLLDHSLISTGWSTSPSFQAPPLQPPLAQQTPSSSSNAAPGASKDMSAWFDLFADLDPLSNPDAIGRSADELLNA